MDRACHLCLLRSPWLFSAKTIWCLPLRTISGHNGFTAAYFFQGETEPEPKELLS